MAKRRERGGYYLFDNSTPEAVELEPGEVPPPPTPPPPTTFAFNACGEYLTHDYVTGPYAAVCNRCSNVVKFMEILDVT